MTEQGHPGREGKEFTTLEEANATIRRLRDPMGFGYITVKIGKHMERISRAWVERD